MAKVVMYLTLSCPFCQSADRLLKEKGAEVEKIRVDLDPSRRAEMMQKSGRRTVPQIWINGQHVGGCDDLYALERAGKLDALLEGNRLILETLEQRIEGEVDAGSRVEGRVVVQAGAKVIGSTIRGPAIIGEGTRVEQSFIGPFTSIYYGCEIVRSEIEHSIVLEQSRIVDMARIEDSLIGKQVEVARSERKPQAYRLMLGDHSRVGLV